MDTLLDIGALVWRLLYWLLTIVVSVLWLVKELILFLVGQSWALWILAGLLVLGAIGAVAGFLDTAPSPPTTRRRVGGLSPGALVCLRVLRLVA